MQKRILILLVATWLPGCVIYVGDDDYSRNLQHEFRTQTLSASGLGQLIATTGAGKLEIIGEEGREDIEFSADIFAVDPAAAELSLRAAGSSARLIANVRDGSRQGNGAHIDLIVKVPARLGLDLKDGSGEISIRGLQGVVLVEDDSGHLALDGAASATIKDGSGHMVLENITGTLFVEDGSGDIEIRNVGGEVTIRDGSGDIRVRSAGGLNILNSGSGDLSIQDVRGEVSL
jgi:hypothetical protein